MAQAIGTRQVSWFDCAGGGQITVVDGIAYVGHMAAPHGTSIVDVRDPKKPKLLSHIEMPPGTHSHKVRVHGDLMIVNHEGLPVKVGDCCGEVEARCPEGFTGGIVTYDVSNPANPRKIAKWETAGSGVHRFDFDGRYAYISPTVEGYRGNIVMILDMKDPARPEEVGRWWLPGQWEAGGEEATWSGILHRCHHPLRRGDRLYTSYWHGGFVILDISDMSKPKMVSQLDWSPPFPWPTHTALPLPYKLQGRDIMVVADEDVLRSRPSYPSFLWLVDITDEKHPTQFSSFQIEEVDGSDQPEYTGCHQPSEKVMGTEIPCAWFAHGMRIVDIKNPHAPTEVARFVPDPAPGCDRVQSNDVTFDDNGLMYLLDRLRGFTIVERT